MGDKDVREWLSQNQLIKQQVRIITKQTQANLAKAQRQLIDTDELRELIESQDTMKMKRKKERLIINKDITKMQLYVSKLADLIAASSYRGTAADYEREVQTKAEAIETLIAQFKQKRREQYQVLNNAEKRYSESISESLARFESWGDDLKENTSKRPKRKSSKVKELHNEDDLAIHVQSIQDLIDQDGGIRGGWLDEDHNIFLKLYTQIPNKRKLVEKASREIPEQTVQSVTEHLQWYHRMLVYERKKKELVTSWKAERQAKHDEQIKIATEEKARQDAEEEEKQKAQFEREQKEKQALVKEWKKMKKEKEQAKKRLEREQARLIEWRKKQKEKAEQERIKAMIEEHRNEENKRKELEEENDEWEKSVQADVKRTNKERARLFKQKQQKAIDEAAKKREEARKKEIIEEKKREKKRLAVQPDFLHVTRDPSRLTQPTKAAMAREQQKKMERLSGKKVDPLTRQASVLPVYNTHTSRATPSWRSGI